MACHPDTFLFPTSSLSVCLGAAMWYSVSDRTALHTFIVLCCAQVAILSYFPSVMSFFHMQSTCSCHCQRGILGRQLSPSANEKCMSNNSINLLCKSGVLLGRSQTARAHWFCSQSVPSYGILMRCFKHIATPESYHNVVRAELREISLETDSSSIISQTSALYVMEEEKLK